MTQKGMISKPQGCPVLQGPHLTRGAAPVHSVGQVQLQGPRGLLCRLHYLSSAGHPLLVYTKGREQCTDVDFSSGCHSNQRESPSLASVRRGQQHDGCFCFSFLLCPFPRASAKSLLTSSKSAPTARFSVKLDLVGLQARLPCSLLRIHARSPSII